jgi:hypothetical protein
VPRLRSDSVRVEIRISGVEAGERQKIKTLELCEAT